MKTRSVLVCFSIVLLTGCIEDPVATDATDNAAMTVDRLFTHDGCSVYRFWDAGHLHYYTDCSGGTDAGHSETQSTGKSAYTRTEYEHIPTYRGREEEQR